MEKELKEFESLAYDLCRENKLFTKCKEPEFCVQLTELLIDLAYKQNLQGENMFSFVEELANEIQQDYLIVQIDSESLQELVPLYKSNPSEFSLEWIEPLICSIANKYKIKKGENLQSVINRLFNKFKRVKCGS